MVSFAEIDIFNAFKYFLKYFIIREGEILFTLE